MQCQKDIVVESSIRSFLTELFKTFKADGIDYAVARDYPTLPESLEGRDLDLVVRCGEIERAYDAVRAAAKLFSAFVLRIEQDYSLFLLVIHSDYTWALRIDLNLPNSNTWRGCCLINLESALQNKISEKGINKLPDEDIFLMQFCRDILFRLYLRDKYHSPIRKLYLAGSVRFEKKLREIFGKQCAARLVEICSRGTFCNLKQIGKQMRRVVLFRSFIREPVQTLQNMARYVYWRCREYIKPNGLMVAVLGPDGAEAEILVASLRRDISNFLQYQVREYRLRPRFLPSPNSLRARRVEHNVQAMNLNAQIASGKVVSTLKLFYLTLDYVFGYWLSIRHILGRKYIAAIFDGYFYEYLAAPARFRLCLPKWFTKLFVLFIPKPDVVVLLTVDADVIKKRKPGLTSKEIRRQTDVMEEFTSGIDHFVTYDTSGDLTISERAMRHAILQKLKKHLE